MVSKTHFITLLLALESLLASNAFVVDPSCRIVRITRNLTLDRTSASGASVNSVGPLRAGFGSGGDDPKKKKKEIKLKPKQQWDRYTGDLKKQKPYRVAVKAEGKNSDEWLEVGNVRSKDGAYTKAAVARQRALIAEVRPFRGISIVTLVL